MLTVREVIDDLMEPVGPLENTVDTLKCGCWDDPVTGIATAFMPSYAVLQMAAGLRLNLVIAHEGPFYRHDDDVSLVKNDPVYCGKMALLKQSNISLFRMHDSIHRLQPDRITSGLIKDLKWEQYVDSQAVTIELSRTIYLTPLTIPAASVREIAVHIKKQLQLPIVRVVGDLSAPCTRVGILPGYQGGGTLAIPYMQKGNLDLVITGEGPEWETPEYVRDAMAQNMNKAMIILGHENSEESGM